MMAVTRTRYLSRPAALGRPQGEVPARRPRRRSILAFVLVTTLALPFFVFTPQGRSIAHRIYELHYKLDAIPGFSSVHHGLHGALENEGGEPSGANAQTIRGLLMRSG